jgi:hypothetical protein
MARGLKRETSGIEPMGDHEPTPDSSPSPFPEVS